MKERRREKGREEEEEEEERYGNYDFVWIVWNTMGLYGFLDLSMVIGLFHF